MILSRPTLSPTRRFPSPARRFKNRSYIGGGDLENVAAENAALKYGADR